MSWTRLAGLVAVVLHLLVAGGTAFAHAQHGVGEPSAIPHVESADRGSCPEPRTHSDCPHCRLQDDRASAGPATVHLLAAPPLHCLPLGLASGAPAQPSVRTPLLPRAPPRV